MREKLLPILNKIKEYNKIILFRHFRPDGDAVGSTKGLAAIIKATYPEKTVLLQNADFSDFLEFLGPEDAPISDEEYADALGIVIDTATTKRISNQKYSLCREIIKIDHHIPVESYGAPQWVEELRSSSSEMIAAFYDTFSDELTLTKEAATYIYCGMVTDSGRSYVFPRPMMPKRTQSAGVESQEYASTPSHKSTFLISNGLTNSIAWLLPLCSILGATTVTSPILFAHSTSGTIPGAKIPSSLVIRILIASPRFRFCIYLAERQPR